MLLADRIIVLGRNPGHVRTDFKVQLAQPRDRKTQAFTALVDYIYKVLTQPDVAPTEVPVLADGRRVRDQRQMRYEMLPHARPGGIAGLLELIIDQDGRTDIYRLADELAFEIDDLFPIVDAAQLLGFLKVEEGDAAITPGRPGVRRVGDSEAEGAVPQGGAGPRAAAAPDQPRAGEQERPLRFGGVLPRPAGRAVQRRECTRQLETAINWGRYAELFDWDDARRRFTLHVHEGDEPAEVTTEGGVEPEEQEKAG